MADARPSPELLWEFLRLSEIQDTAFCRVEAVRGTPVEAAASEDAYRAKLAAVAVRQAMRRDAERTGHPSLVAWAKAAVGVTPGEDR